MSFEQLNARKQSAFRPYVDPDYIFRPGMPLMPGTIVKTLNKPNLKITVLPELIKSAVVDPNQDFTHIVYVKNTKTGKAMQILGKCYDLESAMDIVGCYYYKCAVNCLINNYDLSKGPVGKYREVESVMAHEIREKIKQFSESRFQVMIAYLVI